MKRNWDVIRELLIEVEARDTDQRHRTASGVGPLHAQEDRVEAEHATQSFSTLVSNPGSPSVIYQRLPVGQNHVSACIG